MRRGLVGGGRVVLLVAVMAGLGMVVAAASGRVPRTIYPPPTPSRPGAAFSACPNPAGLERFNAASTKLAEEVARRYGHVSLAADLTNSDRSFWPMLRRYWRAAKHGTWLQAIQVVRGAQIGGAKMVWSGVVSYYCGAALTRDSLNVVVTVRHLQNCNDCSGASELFVDRGGHPLVYMVH